jgi:hypothetical protein
MKWIYLSDESAQRRQPNHPEAASILLLLGGKIPSRIQFRVRIHLFKLFSYILCPAQLGNGQRPQFIDFQLSQTARSTTTSEQYRVRGWVGNLRMNTLIEELGVSNVANCKRKSSRCRPREAANALRSFPATIIDWVELAKLGGSSVMMTVEMCVDARTGSLSSTISAKFGCMRPGPMDYRVSNKSIRCFCHQMRSSPRRCSSRWCSRQMGTANLSLTLRPIARCPQI